MPVNERWRDRIWYIHTMKCYLAIKRDELLVHSKIWLHLEALCYVREATYVGPHIALVHLCEMSRISKSIEKESLLVVSKG